MSINKTAPFAPLNKTHAHLLNENRHHLPLNKTTAYITSSNKQNYYIQEDMLSANKTAAANEKSRGNTAFQESKWDEVCNVDVDVDR